MIIIIHAVIRNHYYNYINCCQPVNKYIIVYFLYILELCFCQHFAEVLDLLEDRRILAVD